MKKREFEYLPSRCDPFQSEIATNCDRTTKVFFEVNKLCVEKYQALCLVVKDADSGSPDQNGGIGSGADCGAPPGAAFTYKIPGTGEQRRACALPRPDPPEVSSGEFPKYGDLSGGDKGSRRGILSTEDAIPSPEVVT